MYYWRIHLEKKIIKVKNNDLNDLLEDYLQNFKKDEIYIIDNIYIRTYDTGTIYTIDIWSSYTFLTFSKFYLKL